MSEDKYIKNYIEFVNDMWAKYKEVGEIISKYGEVTPQKVNTALAYYTKIIFGINAEYRRQKIKHRQLEIRYKLWESEKMKVARAIVFEEYSKNKSIKPAVREFENELRTSFPTEWYEKNMELVESEERLSFFKQLRDDLGKASDILRTLSNNMRTEMKFLHLDEDMINQLEPGHMEDPPKRGRFLVKD